MIQATYLSHYLDDHDICAIARNSFGKANFKEPVDSIQYMKDKNLIEFLAKGLTTEERQNRYTELLELETIEEAKDIIERIHHTSTHWTPFGHAMITLACTAPVPIRTQCYKHKIGFVENEESRRYIKSDPILYVPEYFRPAAKNVKQGSTDEKSNLSDYFLSEYIDICSDAIHTYNAMVDAGIAPEQARFVLPQGVCVNWIWTGSLYAFSQAFHKRVDSHAQKESQLLFKQIGEIIEKLYPLSWSALTQPL